MNGVARASSGTAAATSALAPTIASVVPAPIHSVAVATLDALELVDPPDVDQVVEDGEAQGQHRDEALAAGQHLGLVAELGEQRGGLGGRRRTWYSNAAGFIAGSHPLPDHAASRAPLAVPRSAAPHSPSGRGGERLPAPHRRGGRQLGVVHVDLPLGEPVQHLVERDPAFEPGQRGAQAEVDAVAEGEVLADRRGGCRTRSPSGNAPVVAVGRRRRGAASRCPPGPSARGARRPGDVAADVRRRRLEAQELLDGVRDERPVLDQLAALIGMVGQHLARSSRSGGWWSRCPRRR